MVLLEIRPQDSYLRYDTNTAEIYLTGDIVSAKTAGALLEALSEINKTLLSNPLAVIYKKFSKTLPAITLYISSDGGNLEEAFACKALLENNLFGVRTVALGKAYSSGVVIKNFQENPAGLPRG